MHGFSPPFLLPPQKDHFLITFWPLFGQFLAGFWPTFGQVLASSGPAPSQLFSAPDRVFFGFGWISQCLVGRRVAGCCLRAILSGFCGENGRFGEQIKALRANPHIPASTTILPRKPTHKPCRRCQKVTPRGCWASSVGFFFWSPSPFFTFWPNFANFLHKIIPLNNL